MVKLEVVAAPKTRTVFKVIVYFPIRSDWNTLKKEYFEKKKMYSIKYLLIEDFEFFSPPYEDGDGYELRALKKEKCDYISFYETHGGHIDVSIGNNAQILISYEDDENIKKAKDELYQKALNDI